MIRVARSIRAVAAAALLASTPALAQTDLSPEQVAAAREVVELTGVTDSVGDIARVFVDEGKRTFLLTNPDLAKPLDEAGEALIPELRAKQDELLTEIARAYARRFTLDELRQVAAFYKTPIGKKFRETQPIAQREAFESFRAWSDALSQQVIMRLRAEMKKKGHDI